MLILSILCFVIAILLYLYGKDKYSQPLEPPTEIIQGSSFENSLDDITIEVEEGDMVQEDVKIYKSVLEIPSLDILVNIYNGVNKDALQKGVCRYESTSVLGGMGLTVICGHSSNRWNYVFNPLKNISNNAEVIIWDDAGNKHVYKVSKTFIVEPNETWILEQDSDLDKKVRLFCCADNGKKRLVVEAIEEHKITAETKLEKLLSINDSIIVPSISSELIFFNNQPVKVDNSLPLNFDSDFGIHINERSN